MLHITFPNKVPKSFELTRDLSNRLHVTKYRDSSYPPFKLSEPFVKLTNLCSITLGFVLNDKLTIMECAWYGIWKKIPAAQKTFLEKGKYAKQCNRCSVSLKQNPDYKRSIKLNYIYHCMFK